MSSHFSSMVKLPPIMADWAFSPIFSKMMTIDLIGSSYSLAGQRGVQGFDRVPEQLGQYGEQQALDLVSPELVEVQAVLLLLAQVRCHVERLREQLEPRFEDVRLVRHLPRRLVAARAARLPVAAVVPVPRPDVEGDLRREQRRVRVAVGVEERRAALGRTRLRGLRRTLFRSLRGRALLIQEVFHGELDFQLREGRLPCRR